MKEKFLLFSLFAFGIAFSQSVMALSEIGYAELSLGTLVQIRFWVDDEKKGEQARDLLDKELKRLHALLTVYAKSPLTDLNDHSGRWTAIPCEAKGLIKKSQLIAKATKGAFDPTIGPLVKLWKIGGETGEIPDEKAITKAKSLVSYERIETKESAQGCFARLGKNQSIDLGAIAKGFVGTQLARLLQKSGVKHAILDLGGNIVLLGNSPEGNSWRIGVQDPRSTRGTILATIEEKDTSIVTSGNYERCFSQGEKTYGHILSADTGYPIESEFSSVTVVSPDGALADAWCTAFFVMGKERTLAFLRKHPGAKVFLVDAEVSNSWVTLPLKKVLTIRADYLNVKTIPQIK